MIDENKLIENIEKLKEEAGTTYPYMEMVDGAECALDDVLGIVEDMPKVGEWIPCSERLPEEARAVEVTMYDGNRAIGHFYNRLDTWFDSINGGFIDVIAWKEPSEPWEGE